MAKAATAISKAMETEASPPRLAQFFALFAGLRHAARHIAFAISLYTLLAKEKPQHVVLIGSPHETTDVASWLAQMEGWTVEEIAAEPTMRGNIRERAYRLVADSYFTAALASLLITIARRLRHPAQPRPPRAKVLIEASSRMESYLRHSIEQRSDDFALVQRRHMPIHVDTLYRLAPSLRIKFLDHIALRPRHLLRWLRYRKKMSPEALRALAREITAQGAPGNIHAPLLASLLGQPASAYLPSWLAAEDLIRELSPSKLVLHNDNDPFERALLARARRSHIPVLAIQHGAFTEPMNLDGFEADEYLVWGKGSEDLLRRFGRTRPRISIIGHPGYEKAARHAKARPSPPQHPHILYATRSNSSETASYYPGREADFLDFIERSWPHAQGELIIKPHPRANPISWYRERARKFKSATAARASVTERPLLESIVAADYVISTGGTTVLEAVALKRPCIFILPPGREDVMGWSRFSCLHTLRFGDNETLRRLLAEPGAAWLDLDSGALAEERQRFLEYFIAINNIVPPEEIMSQFACKRG